MTKNQNLQLAQSILDFLAPKSLVEDYAGLHAILAFFAGKMSSQIIDLLNCDTRRFRAKKMDSNNLLVKLWFSAFCG